MEAKEEIKPRLMRIAFGAVKIPQEDHYH